MKIIDLLNKIANGEEVPKYVQYYNMLKDKTDIMMVCKENIFYKLDQLEIQLNSKIESIEEEKKIPEKLDIRQEKNIKNNWKWKVYGKEHSYNISTPQKIIADKVNEICDYLKSKGEEK